MPALPRSWEICEILSPLLCFSALPVSLWKLAHSLTAFLDSRDKWYSQPSWYLNLWSCWLVHFPFECLTYQGGKGWSVSSTMYHTKDPQPLGWFSPTLTRQCFNKENEEKKKKKTEIILTHLKRGHGHCWSILESSMNPLHNQLHRQCKAFHRATWKSLHSPSLLSHTDGLISSEKERQKFKYH